VGQREGGLAISPVRCPEQGEESRVLADGHELARGGRPAPRTEVEPDEHELPDEWLTLRLRRRGQEEQDEQRCGGERPGDTTHVSPPLWSLHVPAVCRSPGGHK